MLRRLPLVMFIISVGFLSYLYEVASTRFNLFPYEIVRDAWVAGKAAREALANEFDQMPPGALTFETAPGTVQTAPQVADAQTPDQGLILMTGGPYKLMAKCPELGCLAWIMDRSGSVYHTWAAFS
jgi:predicted RNA-binding Zn ribbon-like protein